MSTVMLRINRPDSGKPWGFKVQGGQDLNSPLVVASVSRGSIADKNGLEPGDQISSIGGDPTRYMTHQNAQQAIIRCGNELQFLLLRKNGSYGSTPSYNVTPSYTQDSFSGYNHPSSPYSSNSGISPGGRFRSQTTIQVNSDNRGFRGGNTHSSNFNSQPAFGHQAAPHHYAAPISPPIAASYNPGAFSSQSLPKHQPIQVYHQPTTNAMPWSPLAHTAPLSPNSFASSSPKRYGSPMLPKQFESPMSHKQFESPMSHKQFENPMSPKQFGTPTGGPKSFGGTACPVPFGVSPAPQFNKPASKLRQSEPFPVQPPKSAPHPAVVAAPTTGTGKPRHFKANDVRRDGNVAGMAPICGNCHSTIRGPFLAVLDKCYCPNHFTCVKCNRTLEESNFIENAGQLYCTEDYAQYVAPSCAKCSQIIMEDVVTAMDKKWHPGCFLCTQCGKALGEGSFQLGDNSLPYCEEDWADLFEYKCDKCGLAIGALDRVLEVGDKTLHDRCFCCSACQVSLDGKKFVTKNGKPFCKMHANAPALFL